MDWLRISLLFLGGILIAGIWITHRMRSRGLRERQAAEDAWGDEAVVHIRAYRDDPEIEPTLGEAGVFGESLEVERESAPGSASSAVASDPVRAVEPDMPSAPDARGDRDSPPTPNSAEGDVHPKAHRRAGPRASELRLSVGRAGSGLAALITELKKGLAGRSSAPPAVKAPQDGPATTATTAPPSRGDSHFESVSEPRVVGRNPKAQAPGKDKILVLHVVAPRQRPFTGVALGASLERAGLRLGEMSIYHYFDPDETDSREPLFSVANMVAPGTLTESDRADLMTPGLTLFLQVHACEQPHRAFEAFLETSHVLARDLGGSILDRQQSTATNQTLAHMREDMNQWLLRHRPDLLRRKALP